MDLWYHHVHQIPKVTINRGIWMTTPLEALDSLGSMMHKPFLQNSPMRVLLFCLIIATLKFFPPYLTLLLLIPPVNRLLTVNLLSCHVCPSSPFCTVLFAQLLWLPLCCPTLLTVAPALHCPCLQHPHHLAFLHTAPCRCKCKHSF